MALSNWDTVAVNQDGNATNGVFVSPMGITVEFYKNWIYVGDPKGWKDGGQFVKPTVMQLQVGALQYKDVSILAVRGPQNGIFAVVWTTKYFYKMVDGKRVYDRTETTGMSGCGVSGYQRSKWVGVKSSTLKWWKKQLSSSKMVRERYEIVSYAGDKKTIEKKVSRYREFKLYIPDNFRQFNLHKALRFNQGDAFFANVLKTDVAATKPGKAKEPKLTTIVKGMSK